MDDLEELLINENKVYVQVNMDWMPNGDWEFNYFYWENGEKCIINGAVDPRQAHSLKAGGFGMRYTVNFSIEGDDEAKNYTKFMWLEEDKWFMERK